MSNMLFKIISLVLFPLSLAWGLVHKLRRKFYYYGLFKQNHFQVPIISVGNLSFGGTGKTPFTLWISHYLSEMGLKVMVLTRGYKGELENSSGIIKAGRKLGFNPQEFGDEATMLARRLKSVTVVVGKKRSSNLEYYFDEVNPDAVVLDDGHQHLKLGRKLNIVLMDGSMPFSKYKVAPMGYLREDFSALRDTDIIIIGKVKHADKSNLAKLEKSIRPYLSQDTVLCHMNYRPSGFYDTSFTKKFDLNMMAGKNVIAVAGIASPDSFLELLTDLEVNIVKTFVYKDHHHFKVDEMREILNMASKHDAFVVTTEKDMVKMRRIINDDRMLYLEICIEFLKGEERMKKKLQEALIPVP